MTQEALAATRALEAEIRTPVSWAERLFARRGVRLVWVGAATVLLAAPIMLLAYGMSERQGMDRLFEVAAERLELYAGALDSELRRIAPYRPCWPWTKTWPRSSNPCPTPHRASVPAASWRA